MYVWIAWIVVLFPGGCTVGVGVVQEWDEDWAAKCADGACRKYFLLEEGGEKLGTREWIGNEGHTVCGVLHIRQGVHWADQGLQEQQAMGESPGDSGGNKAGRPVGGRAAKLLYLFCNDFCV